MFRRARRAPSRGRRRLRAARTTAWSASGCGARSYTARPALLVRLRGRRARGPGDHRRLPEPAAEDFAVRRGGLRRSTATRQRRRCWCSRCCRPTGLRPGRLRAPGSAPTVDDDFPQLAELARRAAGSTAAADAADLLRLTDEGLAHSRRDRPRAGLRPGAGRDGRVRAAMSRMDLTILYRGPLASCNYDCPYCPFAKRRDSPGQLRADRAALERFTAWVRRNPDRRPRSSVLFTPWGEGLIRSWYREALVGSPTCRTSERVAIQTNLAGRTGVAGRGATRRAVALWCTYHPGQAPHDRLPRPVPRAARRWACASRVGVVGLPEHLDEARRLRARAARRGLPVGQRGRGAHAMTPTQEADVDGARPALRLQRAPARARPGTSAGPASRSSRCDGDGTVRRCHFVPADWATSTTAPTAPALRPAALPASPSCDCHIGYVHLKTLPLLRRLRRRRAGAHPAPGARRAAVRSGPGAGTRPR